jgi:hypothetical protein
LELVLRKSKKKKSMKSKADVITTIKVEPVTNTSPTSMVNIKTEPGTASPPTPLRLQLAFGAQSSSSSLGFLECLVQSRKVLV